MRCLLVVLTVGSILPALGPAAQAADATKLLIELTLDGKQIEGSPLAWDDREVHLLARDGRLWNFAPDRASNFRQIGTRFRGFTVSEMRAELLRELGRDFEATGTSHYLVAHPRGERSVWPNRFEQLYRSLVHYFAVRGFRLSEPPFPLVGIVCRNQADFIRYSANTGIPVGRGVLGYYSRLSNRIVIYDLGQSGSDSSDWQSNATVTIHEATHQTAFNTGLHSRYTAPPTWVAEGLATMFEAPGVYNSRSFTRRSDRINRGRLEQFRRLVAPQHKPELIAAIVASDELFRRSPGAAYAEAWALTFMLMETEPRKYCEYLARTAELPPFSDYTAEQRVADFTAVFGNDWRMLEARLLRFIAALK